MFESIQIPSSFSLVQKGNVFLLLKEEYKTLLLNQGIDHLKNYIQKNCKTSPILQGRTPHPLLPLQGEKSMVFRKYSHGGLLRAFTGNLYLFGARSFQELALTEEIRSCGIPTVSSIGAIHHRIFFPFYQAYFLSLQIPQAVDLIQYFQEIGASPSRQVLALKRNIIRSLGLLLRSFHQAGFFHGDLQLKNILIAGEQLFLIDFDRSYRKPILSVRERMKNLLRLNRSVEKWKRLGLPIHRTDRLRFFLAYVGDDQGIREAMERKYRTQNVLKNSFSGWIRKRV